MDKQQLKIERERLKHQLRDELVEVGAKALEHALRLLPEDSDTRKAVQGYLSLTRNRDFDRIRSLTQRSLSSGSYTLDTCLLHGAERLLTLAVSEKYLSGAMLECAFVGAWNGASCVSVHEQHAEMDYQNQSLRPQIEQAFNNLRTAESQLRQNQLPVALNVTVFDDPVAGVNALQGGGQ